MNRCLARLVGILLIAHLCLFAVLSAGVLASDGQEVVNLTQRETSTVFASEGEKGSLALSPSLQDEQELLSLVRTLSQKVDASLARESERDSERDALRAEVAQLASHNAQLQAQLLSLQRESAFNSSLLGEQERALSAAMQSLHDAQQRLRERYTHTESALALLEEREKARESEAETHTQAVRALTQQAHTTEIALSSVAEKDKETRASLLSLVERVQAVEKEMLALTQSVETQNAATQRMQSELEAERKRSEKERQEMSEKVANALAKVNEAESAVRRVEKELRAVSGRAHTIDVATARLESELKSASVECASQYAYLQEVLATHTERAAAESAETQEVLEDAVLSVRALKERETHTRAEMQQTMQEVRELHTALAQNVSLSQSSLSQAQSALEATLRESLRESVEWRESALRNASHTQDALLSLSSELRTAVAQANTQARVNEETRTQLDALRTHTLASQSALQSDLSQALLALTQVSTQAQSALAQALRERVEPMRTEAERSQRAHASLRKEVLSLAEQLRAVQAAQESLSAHASASVWTATKEGARSLLSKISSKITSKIRMGIHNRPPHTYTHRALSHTAHTPQKERSLPAGTETEAITVTKTETESHSTTDSAALSLPHLDAHITDSITDAETETEKETNVEKESEKDSRSQQQSESEL